MKNTNKLLALLLALVLLLSCIACGEKTPDGSTPNTPDGPSDAPLVHDLSTYSIVYSNKVANRTTDAVTMLAANFSSDLGGEGIPFIDIITDPTENEILIGQTNRPESAEALESLTADDTFVIKTVGTKIVINAQSDELLISAINYFSKLVRENNYGFTKELNYVSEPVSKLEVVSEGKSEFKIVHLAGLDTLLNDGGNNKYDLDVQLGYDLQEEIKKKFSLTMAVVDDGDDRDYEILIGDTSRPESLTFKNSLALNEYGYEIIGNKIVVLGTNSTTTKLAVSLLVETLKGFAKTEDGKASLTLYDGMRITRRSLSWNINIPAYEGGSFGGTLDSGKSSLTVLYKETTPEAFEAYCEKLESEGYVLWQRHDIENNLHATYTHEKNGLIHTYYTANEQSVRIVSYKDGKYRLPTNSEPYTYDVVTRSSITQFGLYQGGRSAGMCYVITLEDGSFIVVDSGLNDDDKTLHHEFFELLKSLNKRPDGNIVIKAWYLTHEHSDHYQMFSAFLQTYGKKVTLEEFWCNTSTKDFTHNGANGNITWEKNHTKYTGYVNGDFEWITIHTGMEFYAANMKFEVLYTEEDLFPKVCRSYNNCILIMKMTDTRSGQTMLWMGDLLLDGCETLAARYDNYLKVDILQAAHHGKSEALSVYKEALPTVVFWPSASSSIGGSYSATNKFLREQASVNILATATNTIELPYAEGNKIIKWEYNG